MITMMLSLIKQSPLFLLLQIFPRWLPPQTRRWSLIFFSCWPAGQGRCSPLAKSMKLLRRTPMTPAGPGSPAWSTSSAASWGPVLSKQCGATATNSLPQAPHQNEASAQRIYFRCALLSFLTPVIRLRHTGLLLVFVNSI